MVCTKDKIFRNVPPEIDGTFVTVLVIVVLAITGPVRTVVSASAGETMVDMLEMVTRATLQIAATPR